MSTSLSRANLRTDGIALTKRLSVSLESSSDLTSSLDSVSLESLCSSFDSSLTSSFSSDSSSTSSPDVDSLPSSIVTIVVPTVVTSPSAT